MLTADILNQEATLNDFDVIGTLQFIPGEELKLVMRMKQPQRKDLLRYIPVSTAVVSIYLNQKDGSTLEKTMTPFADDRSICSCDLSETETEELVSGNFSFEVDLLGDGTKIIKGFVQNGLALIVTGAC